MASSTNDKKTKHNYDKVDFYDDENHDYRQFWQGREYENDAEVVAIKKLLKGQVFDLAMDFGGGYGRLSGLLLNYSKEVILADSSTKQLNFAKNLYKNDQRLQFKLVTKNDYVPADDQSLDFLMMIRVSHHLNYPDLIFKEIYRVLKPQAYAIIEIASEAHFINQLRYLKKFQTVPKTPTPIGRVSNGQKEQTPFYNHHPKTIEQLFQATNFKVINKLSVSNYRSPKLKQALSKNLLVKLEKPSQKPLAKINFGPSIFYLLQKN